MYGCKGAFRCLEASFCRNKYQLESVMPLPRRVLEEAMRSDHIMARGLFNIYVREPFYFIRHNSIFTSRYLTIIL